MDEDPLGLDPELMRRLGYRTVDMLVDRLSDPSIPLLTRATPREMEERIAGPPPAQGEDFERILTQLGTDVLPFASRCDHPGYFAFIPAAGTWPGALGDFIAAALNIYAGSWMESAGPSQVELSVLGWFKEWIGYPREAAGILVSGGSAANITALACAREALLGAMSDRVVAYVSDQGHSSIARAARNLGFRPDQVRVLPADERFRMRPDMLVAAMDADVDAGRRPLFVSASAGSTNTGAVDPLPELAAVCRERGVWFHVDGAYGAFAALTERGRGLLSGMELADSVTLDPHKWLYQPFECGCLLVRDGRRLSDAFRITPDYLRDAEMEDREVNFSDHGMQLTRMSRALKVWVSVRYFGVDAFRNAIDRCIDLAQMAQAKIERSATLELMNPASLSVVCFRRRVAGMSEPELAQANRQLVHEFEQSGLGLVSSTRLHGRYAIRLCVLNHTSTAADVERALAWFEQATVATAPARSRAVASVRDPHVEEGWLAGPQVAAQALRSLRVFQGLPGDALAEVAAAARVRQAAEGEVVVAQWETSRDFYVILDGGVAVSVGEARVAELGPGEFFGELAALEWGASFSYPRLASIVATSATRLLVLSPGRFNELVHDVPSFGDLIRQAMSERLPTAPRTRSPGRP